MSFETGGFEGPKVGDCVRIGSMTVVQPNISITYKILDKKKVNVFLLLGQENKDGTEPLDAVAVMNQLGWYAVLQRIDDVGMRELLSAKDVGKGRAVLKRLLTNKLSE